MPNIHSTGKAEAHRSFPTSTGVKSHEGGVWLRVIWRSDLEGICAGARQQEKRKATVYRRQA
ncbi:hypothetical protein ACSVDA_13165 [Cytobacillus sp. Hm23]